MNRTTPQPYTRITVTRQGEQKRSFSLPIDSLNEATERVIDLIKEHSNGLIIGSDTKLQMREVNGKHLGTSRTIRYYGLNVSETERLIKRAFGVEWSERVGNLNNINHAERTTAI